MLKFTNNEIHSLEKYLGVKETPGIHEQKLLEKVSKYNSYFRYIPGISCICICNSLAMNSCHKGSDIDLFVVTKKNRLWTARIFLTFFLSLIGQRKTKNNHAEKFCLSFFITEDSMYLEDIAIKNDIYLAYWIETLKPLLNRERCYQRFLLENNKWLDIKEKPLSDTILHSPQTNFSPIRWFGNLLESLLKTLFLPRTKKSFQKLGKPFGVTISNTMLKFHDQDKREEIRDSVLN